MMHLQLSDDAQEPLEATPAQRNWSEEVVDLEERVKAAGLDVGPLGARTFNEADLQPAYQRLFMEPPTAKVRRDAVYDLLERIPVFWQEVDAPIEHILTTYVASIRFKRS